MPERGRKRPGAAKHTAKKRPAMKSRPKKRAPKMLTAKKAVTSARAGLTEPVWDVVRRAVADPEFWRELGHDPEAALHERAIVLSSEDLRTVLELLESDEVPLSLTELMACLHGAEATVAPGRWPNRS